MRYAFGFVYLVAVVASLCMLITVLTGCSSIPLKYERISLSWEKDHQERIAWSDALVSSVKEQSANLSKASDLTKFCPKYKTLSEQEKVKALSEIFVGMSYYESGWKPQTEYRECDKSRCRYGDCFKHATYGYCMKGNPKYDGGVVTSRGLLQMSINSSNSYGCGLKDSSELHDPIKNLKCAVLIMKRLVELRGEWTTPKNYWSVVKSSYSGNKIEKIKDRVLTNASFCK